MNRFLHPTHFLGLYLFFLGTLPAIQASASNAEIPTSNNRDGERVRNLTGQYPREDSRLYWHNKNTRMVSDVPSEASLPPRHWGPIQIGR